MNLDEINSRVFEIVDRIQSHGEYATSFKVMNELVWAYSPTSMEDVGSNTRNIPALDYLRKLNMKVYFICILFYSFIC